MKRISKFLCKYLEDIFIFSGLAVVVGTTFLVNFIAGMYALGAALFGLGVYFAKVPIGRR